MFVLTFSVLYNYSLNTLSMTIQCLVILFLQIRFLNNYLIGKAPLVAVMLLVGVFVVVPILINRYESRRREIELFVLKRRAEKRRDLF